MLDNDLPGLPLSLPTIDNSFEPTNSLGDNTSNIDLSSPVQYTPQPLGNQQDVNTSVNTLNNDSVFSFDNNIDMYNMVNSNLNNFNSRNENAINRIQQQQNNFNYPLSLQQQHQIRKKKKQKQSTPKNWWFIFFFLLFFFLYNNVNYYNNSNNKHNYIIIV